jgi:hypothetical protein
MSGSETDLPDWALPSQEEAQASALAELAAQVQQLVAGQQALQDTVTALSRSQLSILQGIDRKQDRTLIAADKMANAGEIAFERISDAVAKHIWNKLLPAIAKTDEAGRDLLAALKPARDIENRLNQLEIQEKWKAEQRAREWWKLFLARGVVAVLIFVIISGFVTYMLSVGLPRSASCALMKVTYEHIPLETTLPDDPPKYRTVCSIGELE